MLAFLQWVDKVNVNLNVLYFRLFINVFIYLFFKKGKKIYYQTKPTSMMYAFTNPFGLFITQVNLLRLDSCTFLYIYEYVMYLFMEDPDLLCLECLNC